MSTHYGLRMLLKRQEAKKYGTCHILEGNYEKGDRVIMVDDVLMTGGTLVDDIPVSLLVDFLLNKQLSFMTTIKFTSFVCYDDATVKVFWLD